MTNEDDKLGPAHSPRTGPEEELEGPGASDRDGDEVDEVTGPGKGVLEAQGDEPDYRPVEAVNEAERIIEAVVQKTWTGILPSPEDLHNFTDEERRCIMRWADDANERQNLSVKTTCDMDRAQSDRMDKLVDSRIQEIHAGQVMTMTVYVALILIAVLGVALGNSTLGVTALAAFAGVTIGKMVTDSRGE